MDLADRERLVRMKDESSVIKRGVANSVMICAVLLLQDIIEDDEIKLDWLFKASLVYDLANVSSSNLLMKLIIIVYDERTHIYYVYFT